MLLNFTCSDSVCSLNPLPVKYLWNNSSSGEFQQTLKSEVFSTKIKNYMNKPITDTYNMHLARLKIFFMMMMMMMKKASLWTLQRIISSVEGRSSTEHTYYIIHKELDESVVCAGRGLFGLPEDVV